MKLSKLFLGLLLLASLQSGAAGRESGGGNPSVARAEVIEKFINDELKGLMFAYIDDFHESKLSSNAVAMRFKTMIQNGLKSDVANSTYDTKGACYSNGEKKPAATVLNQMAQTICFDPKELARQGTTQREIVALAFHEHAHHFGFSEEEALEIEVNISAKYRELDGGRSWSCSVTCGFRASAWTPGTVTQTVSASGRTAAEAYNKLKSICEVAWTNFKSNSKDVKGFIYEYRPSVANNCVRD